MTKNIQKIIRWDSEISTTVCRRVNKFSWFCVSENSLNYENSRQRTQFKTNSQLLNPGTTETSQRTPSIVSQINSRNGQTVLGQNGIPLYIKRPTNQDLIARFHTECIMRDKKQTQPKAETKEELEENWGGPEAFKLIIFLNNDFEEVITLHPAIMVFFSASWCPHCLKMRKSYGKAALMAKEANLPIAFATFDVNINPDIADSNGVVGIPMVKYYQNGKFVANYRGKRTTDGLFEFVKNPPKLQTDMKKADI